MGPDAMQVKADGPALYRWLEAELQMRPGMPKPGPWGKSTGVASDATISRWSTGATEPSWQAMQSIASELGRSLIDVLLAANVIAPDDVAGRTPMHVTPMSPEDAIMLDHTLTEQSKRTLVDIVAAFRAAQFGEGPDFTISTTV